MTKSRTASYQAERRREKQRKDVAKALASVDLLSDVDLDRTLAEVYSSAWSHALSKASSRGLVHWMEVELFVYLTYELEGYTRPRFIAKYQEVAANVGLPARGKDVGFYKVRRAADFVEHMDKHNDDASTYGRKRIATPVRHVIAHAFNTVGGMGKGAVKDAVSRVAAEANIILFLNGWHPGIEISEETVARRMRTIRASRYQTRSVESEEGNLSRAFRAKVAPLLHKQEPVSLYDILYVMAAPSRIRCGVVTWNWQSVYTAWEYVYKYRTMRAVQESRTIEPSYDVNYVPPSLRAPKKKRKLSEARFIKQVVADLSRPERRRKAEARVDAGPSSLVLQDERLNDEDVDWDAELDDPVLQAMMAGMTQPRVWVEPEDTEESLAAEARVIREAAEDAERRKRERDEQADRLWTETHAPIGQADVEYHAELLRKKEERDKQRAKKYFENKKKRKREGW